jgi:hypothetical protein
MSTIDKKVPTYNMEFYQGAQVVETLIYSDNNRNPNSLVGYTAAMDIRDPQTGQLLCRLDTSNGGLTISGVEGKITLTITSEITAEFTWSDGVYDLWVYNTALASDNPLIRGKITVYHRQTHKTL